ncbi:MAG: hypothetical protein HY348_01820 [Nitrospira defluvii]|nr:hypothetical protein [Nitrospira defluvii]
MINAIVPSYSSAMSKLRSTPKLKRPSKRYGAAELFGRAITSLPWEELNHLSSKNHKEVPCPFKASNATCHKKDGVCSLGLYELGENEAVSMVGQPVTTCPSRFLEGDKIFQWVSQVLLGAEFAKVVKEVSFLMSDRGQEVQEKEVGRIDSVLVSEEDGRLNWCALEMQSVYFSGGNMESEFEIMRTWGNSSVPFPSKHRRPDFRSSGPKRLMPQLQIKVPTLSRWGKKMAVIVDRTFWESLGTMQRTPHISNADIVWFVVAYDGPIDGRYHLRSHEAVYTTLEHAVIGLTGGTPVSLEQFELAIRTKIGRGEAR